LDQREYCPSFIDRCDKAHPMIRFSDDDQGYLAWIAEHPDGFVLLL
jgi:hypothetical protein